MRGWIHIPSTTTPPPIPPGTPLPTGRWRNDSSTPVGSSQRSPSRSTASLRSVDTSHTTRRNGAVNRTVPPSSPDATTAASGSLLAAANDGYRSVGRPDARPSSLWKPDTGSGSSDRSGTGAQYVDALQGHPVPGSPDGHRPSRAWRSGARVWSEFVRVELVALGLAAGLLTSLAAGPARASSSPSGFDIDSARTPAACGHPAARRSGGVKQFGSRPDGTSRGEVTLVSRVASFGVPRPPPGGHPHGAARAARRDARRPQLTAAVGPWRLRQSWHRSRRSAHE